MMKVGSIKIDITILMLSSRVLHKTVVRCIRKMLY